MQSMPPGDGSTRWPDRARSGEHLAAVCLGPWFNIDVTALPRPLVGANGCFDLFGPHHVWLLQQASRLGFLVVAVNTDDSVKRLKGSKRPVLPLDLRVRMLSCCRGVGAVTWFDETTPEALWERLRPDYLCRLTTDVRPVAGEKWAKRLVLFKPFPWIGTTGVIERIQHA